MAKSRNMHVKMSEEGYSAIEQMADKEGKRMSDIVRDALTDYAKREHKMKVDFSVEYGGVREKKGADRD